MSLWDYAVRLYRRPGVEPALLALQDAHGQCVSLLIWRLWTIAEGRAVDQSGLQRAVAAARAWEDAIGAPLRAVRRRLKGDLPEIAGEARTRLREDVKAVELAAEQILLEALEALTAAGSAAAATPAQALAQTAAAWGVPAPTEALQHLILVTL